MLNVFLRFRGVLFRLSAVLAVLAAVPFLAGTVRADRGLTVVLTACIMIGLFALLQGTKWLLRPGTPMFGMAGSVVQEAISNHWVFWMGAYLLAALLGLACLPGTTERLDYAERFFLQWAQLKVEVTLGVFTLVFAARCVSSEYAGRQIHTNLSKPVSRFTYLAGKWLGIMLVNTVLAVVAGAAIYAYTGTIEARWVADSKLSAEAQLADRQATRREVLSARFKATPGMERTDVLSGYFLERLETMVASGNLDNSEAVAAAVAEARKAGTPPAPETFQPLLSKRDYANCMELATGRWYTLGLPEEQATLLEPSQVYVFPGLFGPLARGKAVRQGVVVQLGSLGLSAEDAKDFLPLLLLQTNICNNPRVIVWGKKAYADPKMREQLEAMRISLLADRLQLVLNPHAAGQTPREGMAELRVEVNGHPLMPLRAAERQAMHKNGVRVDAIATGSRLLPVGQPTTLEIPFERIDDSGCLAVRLTRVVVNGQTPQPTISFESDGGITLYGPTGPFALNLGAAMSVMLVKMGFVAMLGLVCGSLLSFPVACMVAVGIYAFAACAGGLADAFDDFVTLGRKPTEGLDFYLMWAKKIIRICMSTILKVSPDFEAYDARTLIVDGVQVSWAMFARCAATLGLLWTGGVALAGWFLFERREIARVIV